MGKKVIAEMIVAFFGLAALVAIALIYPGELKNRPAETVQPPEIEIPPVPVADGRKKAEISDDCEKREAAYLKQHQINLGGGGSLIVEYEGTKEQFVARMKGYGLEVTRHYSFPSAVVKINPGTEIEWTCRLEADPLIKNVSYNSLSSPTGE